MKLKPLSKKHNDEEQVLKIDHNVTKITEKLDPRGEELRTKTLTNNKKKVTPKL